MLLHPNCWVRKPPRKGPSDKPDIRAATLRPKDPAPLCRREDRRHDGDPGAEDHGAPESLDGAGEDENGDGYEGERRRPSAPATSTAEAEGEDPLPAGEVGEPAERDEEHGRGRGCRR